MFNPFYLTNFHYHHQPDPKYHPIKSNNSNSYIYFHHPPPHELASNRHSQPYSCALDISQAPPLPRRRPRRTAPRRNGGFHGNGGAAAALPAPGGVAWIHGAMQHGLGWSATLRKPMGKP